MTEQAFGQRDSRLPSGRAVLYGSPHSQFTFKVALMLRLAHQPFSFRYVSFRKREHRTETFLQMSRWGQVPVLQDTTRILVQSAVILEYLAEGNGAFRGEPDDVYTIREWLHWDADRLAAPIYACYGAELRRCGLLPGAVDDALDRHYRDLAASGLASLDALLSGRTWLVGRHCTIADVSCFGDAAFAAMCGFALESWPNIRRWTNQIEELPGAQKPLELLPMHDAEFD